MISIEPAAIRRLTEEPHEGLERKPDLLAWYLCLPGEVDIDGGHDNTSFRRGTLLIPVRADSCSG